ncbi:tigger transposable element-derived protein 6-like isoform X2 [Watersipora subatra]|uniref:tigger transposable element-derived protein 6-like isoform X2 n=1 Tax=Watersipora subatra TaxID=2589382 RepID=UPI00355BF884
MASRKQRKAWKPSDKLKIIEEIEAGQKLSAISKRENLPKSTVSTWIKQKDRIRSLCDQSSSRLRDRSTSHDDLDGVLWSWFRQVRSEGVPIDGPILLEKANKFLQDLGKDTTVSRGWIDRWKKRHSIGCQIVVGESAAVNVGEVENWKEEVPTSLLQTYTCDDIFNMNETGLFYKLMLDKTLHFKGAKCSGEKLSKERLTVALCANMSGTEKEVPIVIGKLKRPHCFKNVTNLPCQYYHNKKACMVSDIFQTWVRDFDRRMTIKNRKVLLIIDNCPAHPTMNGLMSIRLVFTSPNTKSVLQPMDQGIIRTFKSYYCQQVLQFTVDYIDTHGKKPVASINVLQAIRWVHRAWNCVTKETIVRCFHHQLGHTNLDQTDVVSTVDDNEEADTVRNLNLLLHTIDPTSNVTASR